MSSFPRREKLKKGKNEQPSKKYLLLYSFFVKIGANKLDALSFSCE